jgi:hypothetical protein
MRINLLLTFEKNTFTLWHNSKFNQIMGKSKDAKKEVKKVATKTVKEKRAEKKDKKPKYD